MKHVSLNEPGLDLKHLVEQMNAGEELILFNGEKAIARVSSLADRSPVRQQSWDALISMLEGQTLSHLGQFDRSELYSDAQK